MWGKYVERRQEIQRTMYAMVAVDAALLILLLIVFLRSPSSLTILAAIYLPTVLIFNVLLLRRKLKMGGFSATKENTQIRPHAFSLYACSAIFFTGTVGGLLTISHGELPRTTLPGLLFPFLIAVYCLRLARRQAARTPKPSD
jgi:hypothetical protein